MNECIQKLWQLLASFSFTPYIHLSPPSPRLLNANKIHCVRANAFQDLQNLSLLSLYDNKIQTLAKGTFTSLRAIQTLWVKHANTPLYVLWHILSCKKKWANTGIVYSQVCVITQEWNQVESKSIIFTNTRTHTVSVARLRSKTAHSHAQSF